MTVRNAPKNAFSEEKLTEIIQKLIEIIIFPREIISKLIEIIPKSA